MPKFIQVAHVTKSGHSFSTTFDGFASESCARKFFNELKCNNSVSFVSLHERNNEDNSFSVVWSHWTDEVKNACVA